MIMKQVVPERSRRDKGNELLVYCFLSLRSYYLHDRCCR